MLIDKFIGWLVARGQGDGVFGGLVRDEWIDFGPRVVDAGLYFSRVLWNWTRPKLPGNDNYKKKRTRTLDSLV